MTYIHFWTQMTVQFCTLTSLKTLILFGTLHYNIEYCRVTDNVSDNVTAFFFVESLI